MEHLSLKELNTLIKDTLSSKMDPSYWIVAEIGELRLNQSGHCYLEFIQKEENGARVEAKIRGTIWSYTYRTISAWFESITGEQLRAGITVLANVQVSFHEVYGLSLNIKDIDPNFTLGERARKKQEVISSLQQDGIFEMNKQLPLPLIPQRLAVISAESAAGYGDFINQLEANPYAYNTEITLFQATMQGDKASASIINALLAIHQDKKDYDAVIIIRGGGAQVDLDCFDEYELCAHVAQFPLPVFTGIGHERDESVCDLVAHTSLKTPTAVAEFILRGFMDYEENLYSLQQKILKESNRAINQEENRLSSITHKLRYSLQKQFTVADRKLDQNVQKIKTLAQRTIQLQENKLDLANNTLKYVNPQAIFKRGYSHSSINGKSIQFVEAKKGDEILTISAKQKIKSIVQESNSLEKE